MLKSIHATSGDGYGTTGEGKKADSGSLQIEVESWCFFPALFPTFLRRNKEDIMLSLVLGPAAFQVAASRPPMAMRSVRPAMMAIDPSIYTVRILCT
jgi:hypothetical protein